MRIEGKEYRTIWFEHNVVKKENNMPAEDLVKFLEDL